MTKARPSVIRAAVLAVIAAILWRPKEAEGEAA